MKEQPIYELQQFVLQGYNLSDITLIGSGSYAKVYKIHSLKHNRYVAVKQIDMKKIRQQNHINSLVEEIQQMKQLKNQHLVELYQSSIRKRYCYVVLELCENDLRKIMCAKKGKFGSDNAVFIVDHVVKCLKVFVQKSYIHRDIKPQNILYKDGVYKLTDLGFVTKADINCQKMLEQSCGTPIYMAPQILFGEPYTAKCDIWSLGLVLYELIYGSTPWPVKCVQNYRQIIKKRPLSFPFDIKIGKQAKDFIKKALVVDQNKRMSWKQLFQHPLIKNRDIGQVAIPKYVNQQARRILLQLQRQTKRKFVNIIEVFQQFQNIQVFDYQLFSKLLKKLNPPITTYEIKIIYEACDKDQNNLIQIQQFRQVFCHQDYSEANQSQRQVEEIIGIICAKQIEVKDLFERFDTNNSGTLTLDQFYIMIKSIAPKYAEKKLQLVFNRIDSNCDGIITKAQFCKCVGVAFINNKSYVGIWVEKASKNIKNLKKYLKQHKISTFHILNIADNNNDMLIDIEQFRRFVEIIDFPLTMEQITDIFKLLDTNHSNRVSLGELEDCIDV